MGILLYHAQSHISKNSRGTIYSYRGRLGLYRGYIVVILGIYRDNGKENGNYYLGPRIKLSTTLAEDEVDNPGQTQFLTLHVSPPPITLNPKPVSRQDACTLRDCKVGEDDTVTKAA